MFTDKEYTKHYYIEGERVCSKIGSGFATAPTNPISTPIGFLHNYPDQVAEDLWIMVKRGVECSEFNSDNVFVEAKLMPAGTGKNGYEEQQYFYHPDHIGSSSFITDTIGYATQHLQYLPFGETFVDQQNGYDSRYTFSAKEKDDETQYSYFGARYYDSDLSVWLSVDAASDMYPSTSPYMYVRGNPVMRIDPNGMWDTDYYDIATGEHISHVDDGIDEAIAVNRMTYNALKESDGTVTNKAAKQVGGVSLGSNTKFEKIAAAMYGEMDYKSKKSDFLEATAHYNVLENRASSDEFTPSTTTPFDEMLLPGQVNGYAPNSPNSPYNIALAEGNGYPSSAYNKERHNAARKGVMLGMTAKSDFSNKALYWQGRDLAVKGSPAYNEYFLKGILFKSSSHDIFNMGSFMNNGAYKYQSTAAYGATIFIKQIGH